MIVKKFLFANLLAGTSGALLSAEEETFAVLLKRQEPGTPLYNCHDNCGTAITLSKQPNPCDNNAFQTDYANCLQCAGPDNTDIWQYYGHSLSTIGTTCGLSTEPKSGKQPDVGPVGQNNSSSSEVVGQASSAQVLSATPSASAVATTTSPLSSTSQTETENSMSSSTLPPIPVATNGAVIQGRISNNIAAFVFLFGSAMLENIQ